MILDALFGRFAGSAENPSNPIDDGQAENIGPVKGGIQVTRDNSQAVSALWRGLVLLTGYVGKIPCKINKRVDNAWEPDREHPAYTRVHRKANRIMTARTLRQTLTKHAILDGNGFAAIDRELGMELWPLDPIGTYPVVWHDGSGMAPQLEYVVTFPRYEHGNTSSQMWRLSWMDVLHIKGLSDNGIEGLEMLRYAEKSIGLALEAEQFGRMYFKTGLQPSGVLMYPKRLKPAAVENLKKSFERAHSGIDKAFRLVVVEEGGKLEQSTIDNEKAQFLQTRDYQARDIANFLNMPPHKVGDTSRQGYASLEQENQAFLDDSLDPWLTEWEGEYESKLLTEEEQTTESHNVRFQRNAVVSIDIATRYTAYNTALNGGVMNPDEIRGLEGMPPRPGGSLYYVPLNMGLVGTDGVVVPASGSAIGPAPQDDGGSDRQAYRDLIAWALVRGFHRVLQRARFLSVRSSAKLLAWLDGNGIASEQREPIESMLAPPLHVARVAGVADVEPGHVAEMLIGRIRRGLLSLAESETEETLAPAIAGFMESNRETLPEELAAELIP